MNKRIVFTGRWNHKPSGDVIEFSESIWGETHELKSGFDGKNFDDVEKVDLLKNHGHNYTLYNSKWRGQLTIDVQNENTLYIQGQPYKRIPVE